MQAVRFLQDGRVATKWKNDNKTDVKDDIMHYLSKELWNAVPHILKPLDCWPNAEIAALVSTGPLEQFQVNWYEEWRSFSCKVEKSE